MRLRIVVIALWAGCARWAAAKDSGITLQDLAAKLEDQRDAIATLTGTVFSLTTQLAASEAKAEAQGDAITSLTTQLGHEKAALAAMTSRVASLEAVVQEAEGQGPRSTTPPPPPPPALDPRIKTLAPDERKPPSEQERRRTSAGGGASDDENLNEPGVAITVSKETGMLNMHGRSGRNLGFSMGFLNCLH